jgi:WD40 repeat protein
VRVWDPATGAPVGPVLTGHTGRVEAVAALLAPDGRTLIASGSTDGTIRVWNPTTGMLIGQPLTGHTGGVWAVAALPDADGRTLLVSGSGDGTVRVWDPDTGLELVRLITGAPVLALCVGSSSARGSEIPFLAIAGDQRLAVLDVVVPSRP